MWPVPRRSRSRNSGRWKFESQITEVVCEEGWSYIAEWTGTPLAAVLNAAGVRDDRAAGWSITPPIPTGGKASTSTKRCTRKRW
jgi:hypothetical protein